MSKEAALQMVTETAPAAPVQSAVEGTTTDTTPTQTPPTIDAARIAAMARKEAAFAKQQEQFRKERETTLAERQRAAEVLKKAEEFEATRKTDPVAALRMIGFNETEIFNFLAAQEKKELTPEERATEIAKEAAKAEVDALRKEQQTAAQKAEDERDAKLLGGFKAGMLKHVQSNSDKLPFCNYYGDMAVQQAYLNVLETVKQSKGADIPTLEEAMQDMEELYKYQYQAMHGLMNPKPKEEVTEPVAKTPERTRTVQTPAGSEPPKPVINRTRTLSNAATASTAGATKRQETREQLKERLKAQLMGFSRK